MNGTDHASINPPPPAPNQVYLGTFIYAKRHDALAYLHNTAVYVSGATGRIVAVEPNADRTHGMDEILTRLGWSAAETTILDATSTSLASGSNGGGSGGSRPVRFFFPGFVDTHIHASQYPNAGIFGKSTLLDWLNTYTFPLEASLSASPPPPQPATAAQKQPQEHQLDGIAKAKRIYTRCVRRTLAHGTTCAAYFATRDVTTTNLLAAICLAAGQRALVGRVCMDAPQTCPPWYRDASAQDSVRATAAVAAYISQRLDPTGHWVRPIVTPRFAPSCTREAMLGLGQLAAAGAGGGGGMYIQTHVSENTGEIALVRDLFPEEFLGRKGKVKKVDQNDNNNNNNNNNNNKNEQAQSEGGGEKEEEEEGEEGEEAGYVGVYDAFNLLTNRTILAHAVHLSETEARTVAARGAGVSHCPCSNSSITSGAARVRWLLDRGIRVGLGTDVSGGYSPSVLEAARQAILVSRHVAMGMPEGTETEKEAKERTKLSVDEVLWLATGGGASLVGLGETMGRFEVGMEWDAQLVGLGGVDALGGGAEEDYGDVDVFGWESWEDVVAKWLYSGDDRNTKKVWVRGRLVHERR